MPGRTWAAVHGMSVNERPRRMAAAAEAGVATDPGRARETAIGAIHAGAAANPQAGASGRGPRHGYRRSRPDEPAPTGRGRTGVARVASRAAYGTVAAARARAVEVEAAWQGVAGSARSAPGGSISRRARS
jgi:hypothetical protein